MDWSDFPFDIGLQRRHERAVRNAAIIGRWVAGQSIPGLATAYGLSTTAIRGIVGRSPLPRFRPAVTPKGLVCRTCRATFQGKRRDHLQAPEHFWNQVNRDGEGCWEFTGARYPKGYGHFRGKFYAHRMAYELTNGPVPAGLYVCHRCDNPPCCNPAHLYAGTPTDNAQDRSRARLVKAA